eukprot:10814095-Ditylum_brightwellii.AAC.1
MMREHKLRAQIALLKVELTKKNKMLREKDKMLAKQKEQIDNLVHEQRQQIDKLKEENELLQAEQHGPVREKK